MWCSLAFSLLRGYFHSKLLLCELLTTTTKKSHSATSTRNKSSRASSRAVAVAVAVSWLFFSLWLTNWVAPDECLDSRRNGAFLDHKPRSQSSRFHSIGWSGFIAFEVFYHFSEENHRWFFNFTTIHHYIFSNIR